MSMTTNLTSRLTSEYFGDDGGGRSVFVSVIKSSYRWTGAGAVVALPAAAPAAAIEAHDRYAHPPAGGGLASASEEGPPKPRVDVWLVGELVFATPLTQVDVALEIGNRIRKTARVFGDRHFTASLTADALPSSPRPIARLPIAWERCFGGADPDDAEIIEPRNPAGVGLARSARALLGKPAPNFEDPETPLTTWRSRPAPRGFGPIAPFWQPRAARAGTYGDAWRQDRFPLLPADFDPLFFNAAPDDQQLDGYRAGEEVRLTHMTAAGRERFVLPALSVPVTCLTTDTLHEERARIDTIVIAPAERRFSLIARAAFPVRELTSVRQIVVGPLSRAGRRALEQGKHYLARPSARRETPG